jgi:N-methylhydantoinase A
VAEPVRVGIDVGGTFTDVVVSAGDRLTVWKLPSTPADQSDAFVEGVQAGLERAGYERPALIAHGTTVATNALLERTGALTAFVATEGFRDLLQIGRQDRPSLYDLWADRPLPLVPRAYSLGVTERIGPGGEVVVPLDEEAAREALRELAPAAPESVAVCLLFSFANPDHEDRIEALVRDALPGARVSLSSRVLPEFREYERASTTVLDAYVGPVIERYVGRITQRVADAGLGDAPVVVMRSGGSTMSAARAVEEPVHTLLSGPAAGVRGAAAVARAAGFGDLVTFDMGGTSTDVCLVEEGEPDVATESSVGGFPFRTPALGVHTVGAGGGSVLWLDPAGALRAGPRSAGAVPGPACYGRGGEDPTVTDAHVVLGHLDASSFLGGRARLDEQAAKWALASVASKIKASPEEVAMAGLAAVRAHMSKAIRVVSVERGRHPRDFALMAFGGAGPMHATTLATELEMGCVLVPPGAGVLSALGLLATPLASDVSLTRPMVDPDPADVVRMLGELSDQATEALRDQGSDAAEVAQVVDCRYKGQAHEVPVPVPAGGPEDPESLLRELQERFSSDHRQRFGWNAPGEPVELVTFRVQARGPLPELRLPTLPRGTGAAPGGTRRIWTPDGPIDADFWHREALGTGDRLAGPCVVAGEESTTVLDPGWEAEVDPHGILVARRTP